jgi:hypothetical protein
MTEIKMSEAQTQWERVFTAKLQYLLEPGLPELPQEETHKFHELIQMAGKVTALGNIMREEIPRYLMYFDVIYMWLKIRRYDMAKQRLLRYITELWLTRSIGALERKAQITTRTEQDISQELGMGGGQEKKKRWGIF